MSSPACFILATVLPPPSRLHLFCFFPPDRLPLPPGPLLLVFTFPFLPFFLSLLQVNNAGVYDGGAFPEDTQEAFDRTFSVNVGGLYFTAQAVARRMISAGIKGRIINISSNMAREGLVVKGSEIYSASKAAVVQMTRQENQFPDWTCPCSTHKKICSCSIEKRSIALPRWHVRS
jgi:hypothetical protein